MNPRVRAVRKRQPFPRSPAAVATILVMVVGTQLALIGQSAAHGATTEPGSRSYFCYLDGTLEGGDITPVNPACAEAVAVGGKQQLWDWFGVLRSDGMGQTRGFIPDGQLCSGGNPSFSGLDVARDDWPYTRLTAGAAITIQYNAWAAHPGEFRLYITTDSYDPNQPLSWDDLEDEPFSVYQQTTPNGTDPDFNTPDYEWSVTLPNKSGKHIIYSVWERSDSPETFYGCADVSFDGGNGEVIGIGGTPPTSSTTVPSTTSTTAPSTTSTAPSTTSTTAPSTTSTSEPSTSSTTTASTTPTDLSCSVALTLSAWNTHYLGNVEITNTGSTTIDGWELTWQFNEGEGIDHSWGAAITTSGSTATAVNRSWNAQIAPGQTASLGFIASHDGSVDNPPTGMALNGAPCS
jgi:chitin-binding protein